MKGRGGWVVVGGGGQMWWWEEGARYTIDRICDHEKMEGPPPTATHSGIYFNSLITSTHSNRTYG
jgi:hypothetical protein